MTSNYMPDVKVEIAFDSGYSTPAASRTWTDVSDYVELRERITIVHGRENEFSVADANSLALTLDNSDGRFTAQRPASPYYPNVKIGRPIRVTATPVGGVASTRFVGYVDEWPVEWNGTDTYAKAVITAHSRIARLGFDAELDATIGEEYQQDSPLVHYTMGEPAESASASDSTPNGGPQLVQAGGGPAVVFGSATGPSTDSLTAAQFAVTGKVLTGSLSSPPAIAAATVEFFVSGDLGQPPVVVLGSAGASVQLAAGGVAVVADKNGTLLFTSPALDVSDGLTHHVCITTETVAGTTTISLYKDGALFASNAGALAAGTLSPTLTVGSATAALAHVAVYNVVLSAARIAAHAAAGLTGFAGETASQRIIRYASYDGIPSAEVAADAGTNPVDAYDITGHTAIDAMRAVEESESGVLYDARDNTLTFKGRAARYTIPSAFTLDAALQQIESDVTPKLDRSTLINDCTITASDGTTARATNPQSIADYGYARATGNVLASNDVAFQAASWKVNTYGEPQPRIPNLGVDFLALSQGVLQAAVFAADMGTRFTAANLPSQASAASDDVFLEGYTETLDLESYGFVFNVSPVTGFDVWTIEDPVFGEYDKYPIAY